MSDTLLNVFLAIAVDNLANAQELTAAEEEQEEERAEVKPNLNLIGQMESVVSSHNLNHPPGSEVLWTCFCISHNIMNQFFLFLYIGMFLSNYLIAD